MMTGVAGRDARHGSSALAAAWTLLFGLMLYVALRIGKVTAAPEVDPARALFDPHSGFFWRILTAMYGAGLFVPLAVWLCRKRPAFAARMSSWMLIAALGSLIAQAVFFP